MPYISRHNKTHSKPHQCDTCGRGLALLLDLNRHMKARHQLGHERYPCDFDGCIFTATRKDNLRQHRIKMHDLKLSTDRPVFKKPKGLDISDHRSTPERTFASASADSPYDNTHAWANKIFLQAATTGDLATLEVSLAHGIDVNLRADHRSSALHCAARSGHTSLVELLLRNGAEIDATNVKHRSPLHEALMGQNLETVQLLFRNGAELSASSITEECLVHSGDIEAVQSCVDYLANRVPNTLMYNILVGASRQG